LGCNALRSYHFQTKYFDFEIGLKAEPFSSLSSMICYFTHDSTRTTGSHGYSNLTNVVERNIGSFMTHLLIHFYFVSNDFFLKCKKNDNEVLVI
jgi:hypothetical protein